MLEFNNYKSVRVIIYTNFVAQTALNLNPLEVFGDMILLTDILSILLEIQFRLKSTFLKCVIVLTKKKFLFKNRVTNKKFKAILISRNLYL